MWMEESRECRPEKAVVGWMDVEEDKETEETQRYEVVLYDRGTRGHIATNSSKTQNRVC